MCAQLIPLGTNGFIPSQGRQTMSFLVLTKGQAILLDSGTGIGRLLTAELAELLQPYSELSLIYSHYHLDHTVGLSYMTAVWPKKPLHIHAPEQPLLQARALEALNGLIRPPYFPVTLDKFPSPVTTEPFAARQLQIGEVVIRVRPQTHAGGSIGIRIDDDIAYTTDTVVDERTPDFVRGAKVLLHELWLDDAETPAEDATRTGHSYASGVVQLAVTGGVGRLMIVHHHPLRTTAQIRATVTKAQATTSIPIVMPEEGKVYEV